MAVADGAPSLLTVPEAARISGIARTLAYQLIREDD